MVIAHLYICIYLHSIKKKTIPILIYIKNDTKKLLIKNPLIVINSQNYITHIKNL